MADSQPPPIASSLDVSGRYLGDQGQEYFQYQHYGMEVAGVINARLFQPFIRESDTLLDFGCGPGTILMNLKAQKKIGIEPNPASRAYCNQRSNGSITPYAGIAEVADQSVDVVMSNHCLEHVPNVVAVLREMHRVLKPGGKIVIFVPIDDWRTQRRYDAGDINHHLHTWTPLLFGHTLAEGGFTQIQTSICTSALPPKFPMLWKRTPEWMFDVACWFSAVINKRRQLRHRKASLRMKMAKPVSVVVLQDGGRLHYAVPVALHRKKMLERVFCDWYSRPGSLQRAAGKLMRAAGMELGQRMLDRYTPDLNGATVLTNPSLTWNAARLKKKLPTEHDYFRAITARTTQWIERVGVGEGTAFYGFIRSMDPALPRFMRQKGIFTLGDQMIAPYCIQKAEELLQRERYPDFSVKVFSKALDWWDTLERDTWAALDHITCASEYVRSELITCGVAANRITLNPYPINSDDFPFVDRSQRDPKAGPLSVGFVGAVNLRKGTPQFWEVANRFDPAKVKFTMVGPVNIHPAAVEKYGGHVELPGAVPRSEIPAWLGRFDIYFFPSTCEGSAGSVIEAMSTGLPVVTSPNSGTVIEHGKSGYIYPYTAVDQYTQAIQQLAGDPALRRQMGRVGRECIETLGLDHFADTMASMLQHQLAER